MDYSTYSEDALIARLSELRQDHADFDAAIQALTQVRMPNMVIIGRLKRKKLALKDEITRVEDYLTPDLLA